MIRFIILQTAFFLIHVNGQKLKKLKIDSPVKFEGDGTFGLCEDESGQMYYFREFENKGTQCQKNMAIIKYSNLINETGWAFVEVEVSTRVAETYKQGYVAGYIEGRTTRDLIRLHLSNTVEGYCNGAEQFCEDLTKYLIENYRWMQQNIASYPDNHYWIQVQHVFI
ncbi:hypothetical protein DICVIV_06972 [Dictyocaulus viviparus]|uniref:Phospholipase B-like n=1 Tax=Dictyocaulus viviparus TaxID=29172 RepID=A0A0D8XQZ6_DICVI|nr:hypothetical protein DICVIV_06972 [Dictyocaulus viviparus]